MAGTSGFEPEHAGVKVLCLTGLATSQYIIYGGQSRIWTCNVSYVTDLQSACFSQFAYLPKKNGAEHKIRTCGPLGMNDRLATCWFKPLTQLSITVVTKNKFRGPLAVSNPLGCTICGLDKRIRTFDPLVPSQVLCQTELHPEIMVGTARFELAWE